MFFLSFQSRCTRPFFFFFLNEGPPPDISPLPPHDALPFFLYRHEIKQQQFTDQPIRGKPTRLIVRRRRYRCRTCDRTFFEAVPEMDEHHFLTKRLTAYIEREALRRTFTSIASEVGECPAHR